MLKDYFIIAYGSLRKRFLRTSLTMLGIFIGIAAVVSLISLGQGLSDAINQQFASVGTDKVIVQSASPGFGPPGQTAAGVVTKDDLELVRRVPGVARAAGRLLKSATLEFADDTTVEFLASLPHDPQDRDLVVEANGLKVQSGRMLKSSDEGKVLVGSNYAGTDEFKKPIEAGSRILLNGKQFDVIGVLKKIGSGRDDSIIMNEEDIRELLDEDDEYSAIFAQVGANENPSQVADRILRAIRRDRHQKEGFEDVTVSTSEDLIASINTIIGVVQAVFVGIAAISLLVGGIGIMNTMYTSVMERTRDIGVMKAIGARNSDILWIFLLESGLLGMAGGAIGVLLGMALSTFVEIIGQGILGDVLKASFPWYLIAGALAFSFVVGAFSGVFPARQASKLPPVEALRGD